jgi:colanic acid biosynthesis glycosyl transferase WcaI
LKILIVSQYFWPEQFLINDLSVSLRDEGHQVEVLTGEPNYPSGDIFVDYRSDKTSFTNYFDIPIHRCKIIPRGKSKLGLIANYTSFILSSSLYVATKLRHQKFDLVLFFQLSPVFSGIPAILYKKIHNVPLITWIQDLWPESLSATGQLSNKKIISSIRMFVKYLYESSDLIYIQSEFFRKKVEEDCSNLTAIDYLPNWADKVFEQTIVEDADFYQKKHGYFDFLFAGNLGDAQDLLNVVTAVSMIPKEKKFRIIMLGDGSAKESVEKFVNDNDLNDKFVFFGRKPIKYMPSAFRKADSLLVTLRDEKIFELTIPSKVQSYLASGRPIVASLSGAGASVIFESKSGLVATPGKPLDLANKLQQMIDLDECIRQRMSTNAKSYYDAKFSFTSIRDKLISDMERII